ncbi:MAG: HAD family hydrolase [Bacillota bacterium]
MLKVLMFDLDGTLLPLDFDLFFHKYFETIAPYFQEIIEPAIFVKKLMASTYDMINNPGQFTNEQVFMDSFLPAIRQNKDTMYPLFEKFYEEEFPKLKKYAGYSQWSAQAIQKALDKGYRICLATNPVFPRRAIEHRMSWAGIERFPWEFVTTYENSYGCKPNPAYYKGICRVLKVTPKECLMVGNDVQEDLVAQTLGMKTFLVTDYLIDRGEPRYEPDYRGSLEELYNFMCGLPNNPGENKLI